MAKMQPSAPQFKPEGCDASTSRVIGFYGWLAPVRRLVSSGAALVLALQAVKGLAGPVEAPMSASASPSASAASRGVALPWRWQKVPRVLGRLTARDLGVVINIDDPYSVEVGEIYARERGIPPERVLRLRLPRHASLSETELRQLRQEVDRAFDDSVQALALAWVEPWSVGCQSITAALSLGLEPDLCRNTCARLGVSAYFNSGSTRPLRDHGLRLSMLLAAGNLASARRLVERGHLADGQLGRRGALPVHAYYMLTEDRKRSVRWRNYPPPGVLVPLAVRTHVQPGVLPDSSKEPILLLHTGVPQFSGAEQLNWAPGALADHLTSFGGQLTGRSGQTSALAWIDAGATASYGTVSEPCNHVQKFPHPQLLLLHYLQGATAIEAYWKSVRWPQQGLFIGDPLTAPFAHPEFP